MKSFFKPQALKNVVSKLEVVEAVEKPIVVHQLDELMQLDLPPREVMLDPWLPERGIAMIYARPGVGKTFVGLNIGYAVASGGAFLKWQAPRSYNVLYIDGEMPLAELQKRLRGIIQSSEHPLKGEFKLISVESQNGGMIDISSGKDQERLDRYLSNIHLIVVDNISTLCRSGKENEAESWNIVQNWAIRMRSEGRTVLFIHHSSKEGHQRGSSKREDAMDSILCLKRPLGYHPEQGALFEVHFEKSRNLCGESTRPFQAQLIVSPEGTVKWSVTGIQDALTEQILARQALGENGQEIAKGLQISPSTVSRKIKKYNSENR